MNAIDRFFLRLFLLPKYFYAKQGVNIVHLRAILTAKLTMDNRRPISFMFQRQRNTTSKNAPTNKKVNNSTVISMLAAFMMGLIMLNTFVMGHDALTKLTMFTTLFIFMLCMILITEFTGLLIDTRDNLILLPKPVSDKTILLARLLHIGIRLSLMLIPMTLPGCLIFAIMEGPWVIVPFMLVVLLMAVFSIFIVNALYLIILKVSTPEKFKSIITGIQIAFVILFFASYQLFPRLMASDVMRNADLSEIFWIRFYPPYWFSEACLLLGGKLVTLQAFIGLALAVLVPVVSIWVVVRFLAPAFTQKLTLITGGVEEKRATTKSSTTRKLNLKELLGKALAKRGQEKAGFLFAWDMMARSKDFRMAVLPQFGYIVVFAFMFYLQRNSMSISDYIILLIYASSLIPAGSITQLLYSEKSKAGWFFHTTPIAAPGTVIGGSLKAALVMFYLPIALFLMVLGLVLQGPSALISMTLGVINVLTISMLNAYINLRDFPFSKQMVGTSKGSNFIKALIILLPMVVVGFLHKYIQEMTGVVIVVTLVSAGASYLLFRLISKFQWKDMKV